MIFFHSGNISRSFSLFYGALKKNKVDPPNFTKKEIISKFDFLTATHLIKEVKQNFKELIDNVDLITLNGFLNKKPINIKKKIFCDLRDTEGNLIQLLLISGLTTNENFEEMKKSNPEDPVSVTGHIQIKKPVKNEPETYELIVKKFQNLNNSNMETCRLEPIKHESSENYPQQYRNLQLRHENFQNLLKLRSKISLFIRKLFHEMNFDEIETPLLFKSTSEGAREFIIPTRKKQKFYALPQSPQQYKQILMGSGFSRYFQFAKCFRDEDLKFDRQPEFTQIDMEMSFINDCNQIMSIIEMIIHSVWKKIKKITTYKLNNNNLLEKIDFDCKKEKTYFNKIKYDDIMRSYGSDKPDLRSDLKIIDLSEFFENNDTYNNFSVIESCVLKDVFDPNKHKDYLVPTCLTDKKNYQYRTPIILKIKSLIDIESWYESNIFKAFFRKTSNFNKDKLNSILNLKPGDLIGISNRSKNFYENPSPLGKLRQLAINNFPHKWNRKIFDKKNPNTTITNYDKTEIFVGSWIINFPLFKPKEINILNSEFPSYDFEQLELVHHPFTMMKLNNLDYLETDPLKIVSESYDLVINGYELGGGSKRIHHAKLQEYILKNILNISDYEKSFGHLLKVLRMGCPPHAGFALGFDRLCMLLNKKMSIKDVIAFPKNGSGFDLQVESPDYVNEKILNDYFIKIKN